MADLAPAQAGGTRHREAPLPVLVLRPSRPAEARWDDAVLAVAAVSLAVVAIRTAATWAA